MTTDTRVPSRQTCTDHCATCGAHFHGLAAFDGHRRDGECLNPETVTAGRGKREGMPVLQLWTAEGYCDKERGCWHDGKRVRYVSPVSIWQMYASEESRARMRGAFQKSYADESDAVTSSADQAVLL